MKVTLLARNAMGVEAEYEVHVESLVDLQVAVRQLYARPGIARVTLPDSTIKLLEEFTDRKP